MSERRLTVRLMQRWEAVRNGKTIPAFNDFETDDLQDIFPYCLVARLDNRERSQITCERMGEQIVALCGRDMTGQPVSVGSTEFPDMVLLNNLEVVCDAMAPIEGTGQFVGIDDSNIRWRACFMPFGSASNELTHIMVGFSFKKVE